MPGAAGGDQRVERCGRLRADQLLPRPTITLLDGRSSAAIHTRRYGIFCNGSGAQIQFPRFDYQRGRARVDPESRGRAPVKPPAMASRSPSSIWRATTLSRAVVRFYNKRGTAEQWI